MPTYSYDPTKLCSRGMDKMRFELGDTTFNPGELTAALCDEEYTAVIARNPSWKKAKIACLKAILMKFAHQATMSASGVSYSFSQRTELWQKLLEDLERDLPTAVPTVARESGTDPEGGHYFRKELQTNTRW